MSHITAILVAYNSAAVIASAIEPLLADPSVARVIVVDNCSTDETCDLIRQRFPKVMVIENPKNDGFGRGNNVGLKKVETPYALLLNPDAVMSPGAIAELLAAAQRYPDAAILAPELLDADGKVHRSFKRNVFSREQSKDTYLPPEGDCCAEFLSGAVWLVGMKHLRTIGFFDPDIFLYYEDDDLCLRVRKAGMGLVFVPGAKAVHLMGASSTPNSASDFFRQRHMTWSRLYLEAKYHGEKAAKKLAGKLRMAYAFKAAIYTVMLKPSKINRYRGRLAGIYEFNELPRKGRGA